MYRFTYPANRFDEANVNKQDIRHLIKKHTAVANRYRKSLQYYAGNHDILKRRQREEDDRPNNKLVCNHAKDIADTASSYFIGNPISYKSNADITALMDALEDMGADEIDGDNSLDLSIFGVAYEYHYIKKNETTSTIKNLSPIHTFMVYDDTIEENELFAIYYFAQKDDTDKDKTVYIATVLTENYIYSLRIFDDDSIQATTEEPQPHYYGEIPVVEYLNNKLAIGDYELEIPLIDAYNALMSDRVNDKEQFIDSILAIYGTLLSDEDAEEDGDGQGSIKAMEQLRKGKLLELPDGSKAEYLTQTFDENGVELLRKAIEEDIHKFSHIPCLTDDSFAGNTSGVAMEFKLLGLENITKIKTRYYKKGLRKRLRLVQCNLAVRGVNIDISGVTQVFTRSMPKNLLEISQYVSNLWGKASKKTLLSQIPFIEDVEEELKVTERESQEAAQQQKELFGITNEPPEDDIDEE